MNTLTLEVLSGQAGLLLDEYLAVALPELSLRQVRDLLDAGRVRRNGPAGRRGERVHEADWIQVELPEDLAPAYARDQDQGPGSRAPDLDVIYEDEHLLALAKPPGLTVGSDRRQEGRLPIMEALSDWFRERSPWGAVRRRPRLVHRLDRDTSGVLVVAATPEAARALSEAFEHRRVDKAYHALVEGEAAQSEGVVDAPIGPISRGSLMRVDTREGKPAVTRWRRLQAFRGWTWLEARPETGRTHQIRVHLAHIGLPLAVDADYGRREALYLSEFKRGWKQGRGAPRPLVDRLTLHAARLALDHPATGQPLVLEAPMPADLARVLKQLGRWAAS